MTEVKSILDEQIAGLSTMPLDDLNDLLYLLERTYIHALIEHGLRGVSR